MLIRLRRTRSCPGAVLVYSLLVLSTLLIVVTGFSLYVMRAVRTLALSTDTAVAAYVAESGVEEGLYLLRREDMGVAAIASTTIGFESGELPFVNAGAFVQIKSTSTVNEILMDVAEDGVEYADVYDASRDIEQQAASNVHSVRIRWDGDGAAWLEASLVELQVQSETGADLQQPRTHILGPSLSTGYCFSNLQSFANLHRLRFRALYGDIRNLRITGYTSDECPDTEGGQLVLAGRTSVSATGRYRSAKQTLQISMPQQTLPSGLFGFVVFSDDALAKLSAGVGNLQILPTIDTGYVWPDGITGAPNTFRFTYPANATPPFAASSTADLRPGYIATGPADMPVFVLQNTARSGSFETGDIILSASGNYAGQLNLDYDFGANLLAYPAANPAIKACSDPLLRTSGQLRLAQPGTIVTESTTDDPPVVTDRYYADRCALGVSMDPTGVTTVNPLRGRLLAYADPGGTASVELAYDPPLPVLRVEREVAADTWEAVTNGTIYDFGGIPEGTSADASYRVCNVGAFDTTLSINAGNVAVGGNAAFSLPTPVGSVALPRVPDVNSCGSGEDDDFLEFQVRFSPEDPIEYTGGYLEVAPQDLPEFRISLRGNASISSPDWDGNYDCWGIGDTNGNGTNEIRCEWHDFGDDSYELRAGTQCLWSSAEGRSTINAADLNVSTASGITCNGTTCSYTYDVAGDTASSASDDLFRCHQVRSIAGSQVSLWSSVRGTTGSQVASTGVKRFFLAYSDTAYPETTFSGDLRAYGAAGGTWQQHANAVCSAWAQRKFGASGNFQAWMCGRNSNAWNCQGLTGNTTYVWLDSGAQSLPGVSFRTDSFGVPPQDYWRGGASGACLPNPSGDYSDCRTERKHVYSPSLSGGIADDYGQYFRTAIDATGLDESGGGGANDCPANLTDSWGDTADSMTYLGQRGQFGSGRWYTNVTRAGACQSNPDYAIYCFEEGALTGAPSGLSVTWSSTNTLAFSATWVDGVSGETGFQVSTSAPGAWTAANRPANSQSLPWASLSSQCALARNFTNPWVFRVAATDGTSWTAPSTASANRPTIPTPLLPRVQWNSASQVTVRWNDVPFESGYVASLAPGSGATLYGTTTAGATSWVFSGLSAGTTYTFKVRAFAENGSCDVFGPETAPITFVMPSSVKRIINSAAHNGNFEDDDGNTGNGNWYVSADAHCTASPGVPDGSKALMWYRPGGGANTLRPGTVTHSGVTYVNPNNVILFRASSDNDVPTTALGPSECNSGSCSNYFTGRASWNDQTDCATWSFGGGGGTAAIIGLYYNPAQWTRYPTTHYSCATGYNIYCVEQ